MNSSSPPITAMPSQPTTVFSRLPNNLTADQRSLLDALWEHLCETGTSFPKRNLVRVLGKRPLNDVMVNMAPGLFVEQFESGEKTYSLTLWGALSTSKGPFLVALFVRLLELVKTLYEEDSEVRQIDSKLICEGLSLTRSESRELAEVIRVTNLPSMPVHFRGQSADRSTWFLAITEDVVELFHASSSIDFLEQKLATATRPLEPHEAWASVFATQPMDVWGTVGISGIVAGQSDMDFVAAARLDALRRIEHAEYDCTRLICLCEELNACAAGRCAHAVILLTRAILDHIPPVFNFKSFAEVSSNYGGAGRSFKASAERLEQHARKVADRLLHQSIRKSEVAPEINEVAFSQELEMILAEVCRILK